MTATAGSNSQQEQLQIYPLQLTRWIEAQPDLAYLVKAAQETPALYERSSDTLSIAPPREDVVGQRYKAPFRRIREFFWPTPADMRGNCYGTKSFDETCGKAANTMAASTMWDAVSTIPFIQFAFLNGLKAWSLPPAIVISILLMVVSNALGRAGANRARGRELFANGALAGFILLSLLKTAFSGIGFDILVNRVGVTNAYAEKVLAEQVDKQESQLKKLQTLSNPQLLAYQDQCRPLQQQLNRPGLSQEERNRLFIAANGTWPERNSMVGMSVEQRLDKFGDVQGIPGVCNKADAQLALDLKQSNVLSSKLSELRLLMPVTPAVALLKNEFPAVYRSEFNEDKKGEVEIRSGQKVVGEATLQFIEKLGNPRTALELGISLFWMAISIVLSVLATFMLWALSHNKEMKMSYSSKLLGYGMDLLQAYQEKLPEALRHRRERRLQEITSQKEV